MKNSEEFFKNNKIKHNFNINKKSLSIYSISIYSINSIKMIITSINLLIKPKNKEI